MRGSKSKYYTVRLLTGVLGIFSGTSLEVVNAEDVVFCKSARSIVKVREGSCKRGETQLPVPTDPILGARVQRTEDQISVLAEGLRSILRRITQQEKELSVLQEAVEAIIKQISCLVDPPTSGPFVDNCDGTITDTSQGLMWEKKTGVTGPGVDCSTPGVCLDPHDVKNVYTWSDGDPWDFDGTAKTDFIDKLNEHPCFAGHCDWRLPEVDEDGGTAELETILDCGLGPPLCIDSIFGPTIAGFYWSFTTAGNSSHAWRVNFGLGVMIPENKSAIHFVRAVRTGG